MYYKEALSALAIALTFIAFVPYIAGVMRGSIKPHVFSWVIWGSTTVIVFLAQLAANAGVGAWPIGVSGTITVGVAALAYAKRSDITITRSDGLFFITALGALPVWFVTTDPTWAVVILTLVDLLGFGPTIRKAYANPYSESIVFYAVGAARNGLAVMALASYSLATVLFPAAISVACLLFILLLVLRRRSLH